MGEYSKGKATMNRALTVYKSGALVNVNRALCEYYGAELHNFSPNSISQAVVFVAVCEGYLGIEARARGRRTCHSPVTLLPGG